MEMNHRLVGSGGSTVHVDVKTVRVPSGVATNLESTSSLSNIKGMDTVLGVARVIQSVFSSNSK